MLKKRSGGTEMRASWGGDGASSGRKKEGPAERFRKTPATVRGREKQMFTKSSRQFLGWVA